MPIQNASDSQKVDFLWKKIVYGAAKTDIAGNIDATQEPNPSPLQIRADKILQDSASIPAVIPGSNSSVVTIYPTTFPVECISTAGIPTPTLTWQTGRTFWVPPEFGSTYQIKVYIAPSGNAANVASKGTQVFATGSGSNDLWVFDYQAGILNFNSNNTPYNGASPISFTGNSVYISGAVYAGQFGLPTASNIGNTILGNIIFNGNTISSNQANGNIVLDPPGTGTVLFAGTSAVGLPSGDDSTRPLYPEIGYTRYNTDRQSIEYYDGNSWLAPGAATISSEVINPDGSANTYTLGSNTTVDSVLVSINGTLQQPIYSYNIVNNNQIAFTETPLTSDIIEVRFIAVSATSVTSLRYGPMTAVALDLANVNVTGNVLPSANVTYDLGSPTLRWRTGYFSANTINIGGGTIGLHDTLGFTFTTPGGSPQYMMPNGASTSNTFTSSTVTIQGNLIVGSNVTIPVARQLAIGNIILRDNGDGKLHARDITDNSDAVIVATISAPSVTQGNIQIGTNHIESTNANGPISLRPNGTGVIVFASNVISAGKGGAELTIATGLAMPAEYGVTYANANILLSPGRDGLYGGNVRVTQTTAAVSSSTGAFQVVGGMGVGGSAFFGANVTIGGNLFVNGNLTVFNTNNVSINDSLIYLADDNPADVLDIGIVSAFTDAVRYQHTGLVRDASDGIWKLFANVVAEPTTTVDFTNATYSNLKIGSLELTNITATGYLNTTGNISTAQLNVGQINTTGNILAVSATVSNIISTAGTLTGLYSANPIGNAATNLGSITNQWGIIYGQATTAQYADLAENYVADHNYVPGTVVDFGGTYEVTISDTDMSTAVAGVVSTNPAYLMNSAQQGTYVVAVALQGRVQTRVQGPIRKGNMLVSAGNGLARAETNPQVGTVLGKALEDFDGVQGTIEIVVGVR